MPLLEFGTVENQAVSASKQPALRLFDALLFKTWISRLCQKHGTLNPVFFMCWFYFLVRPLSGSARHPTFIDLFA